MNKKRKVLLITAIIIVFIAVFTMSVSIYMINNTKNNIVSVDSLNNDYDAVIILGCRVNGDNPSLMLTKRLEKGIDVYNKLNTKIILTGSPNDNGYNEVNVMKEYLLSSDIDSSNLYLDYEGYTTYDSIYRAKYVFNTKKVVIITQKYHMYRALYLAKQLDLDAIGVVADDIPQKFIMLKNEIREIFSRDKNFIKGMIRPKSKYKSELIPVN